MGLLSLWLGVRVPQQAPHARVTELEYVSGSNPGARHGLVSSTLTSCTILQGGRAVMQQLHKLPDVGPTPTPATIYVACSSDG